MEWWLVFLVIFGSLMLMLMTRMPVAFCFILLDVVGAVFIFGGSAGLLQFILSMADSVASFTLTPIPLFFLMGSVLQHSGMATTAIDSLDRILGRLPGRLCILATLWSTIFAALSGSGFANIALLGSAVAPEMRRRGYADTMIMGPIMGGAALAPLIPPSGITIIFASLAEISIGKLLIAGIIPGLIMSSVFVIYIIVRCILNPSLAPAYAVEKRPLSQTMIAMLRDVLPLGLIFFLAVVVIFLGVCTPTEAAALGAVGSVILAASYRKLNLKIIKASTRATLRITVMVLMIMVGAKGFSQILAYTGATGALVERVTMLEVSPLVVLIAMQIIVLFLGCFINEIPILIMIVPLYASVAAAFGMHPMWFGIVTMICATLGAITPPFGQYLFIMQGVSPPGTPMAIVYRAAFPFIWLELVPVIVFLAVPSIVTWLPDMMG